MKEQSDAPPPGAAELGGVGREIMLRLVLGISVNKQTFCRSGGGK